MTRAGECCLDPLRFSDQIQINIKQEGNWQGPTSPRFYYYKMQPSLAVGQTGLGFLFSSLSFHSYKLLKWKYFTRRKVTSR